MEAEITIEYDDARTAEAICNAVSPDNFKTPEGLSVTTQSEDKSVVTSIECQSLRTFLATIDDLLFSVAIAEKALRETVRPRAHKSV